jgi:hypothetical protein
MMMLGNGVREGVDILVKNIVILICMASGKCMENQAYFRQDYILSFES